jgi:hypothetical protein
MGAMDYGEVGEEVVFHTNLQGFVRNGYVKPILLRV